MLQVGSIGASSLTTAELRLVPLLSTHRSFREIGKRLHVSRHTEKTQAISIYRKLGVASRSEAIERVQAVGLLGRKVRRQLHELIPSRRCHGRPGAVGWTCDRGATARASAVPPDSRAGTP